MLLVCGIDHCSNPPEKLLFPCVASGSRLGILDHNKMFLAKIEALRSTVLFSNLGNWYPKVTSLNFTKLASKTEFSAIPFKTACKSC